MSLETVPSIALPPIDTGALRRKILWRIVPLVFVLYIVAYLDRVNLSFAKLRMNDDLNFSDAVFGWGAGIFFVGYLLLEIPGALLVEHWSARKWFARILFTWGLCSMAMALVRTPWQFYAARFLLGLAEAGFFPGVVVYFTHWFPRADRGRAMGGFVLAVPLSLALGSHVSGMLLQVDWLGLPGWQWVFIVEGAPAVLMGFVVLFYLKDRPRDAHWLTPAERDWLEGTLEAERLTAASKGAVTLGQALRQPTVWLLALGIFATNTGGYGFGFWLPTTVNNFLQTTGREATPYAVLSWTAMVYACGLAGVWLSGQSSDLTGERKWHCVVGMACTGLFLAASVIPGQSWTWVFACLCATGFFAFFWPPPFWVLPTQSLSASAAAVSIGFINIFANIAGIVGPPMVGEMKSAGFDDRACLLVLAGCYVAGGAVISLLRVRPKSIPVQNDAELPLSDDPGQLLPPPTKVTTIQSSKGEFQP